MYYASKLRVIVCSSLENIAHPILLSHRRTPQHKRCLSKCKVKKKKKKRKSQRAGGRVEGCYRTVICDKAAAWGDGASAQASNVSASLEPLDAALLCAGKSEVDR